MHYFPDKDACLEALEQGKPQVVWSDFYTDLETPVSALMKLRELSNYHILFESVEGGANRGRYSIIALDPDLLWKCEQGKAAICRDVISGSFQEEPEQNVFDSLRALVAETELELPAGLPPMSVGLFGYMGYDMVKYMEKLPHDNPDTIGIPDSIYMRPQIVVIFDNVKDVAHIVTPVYPKDGESSDALYRAACGRLDAVVETLNSTLKRSIYDRFYTNNNGDDIAFESHISREEYHGMVNKAKEYIVAGDIFQVVPSRRLESPFNLDHIALYRSLRHLNPSPYLFYAHMDGFSLVGSSPEILVKVDQGTVTVRPIAGTRKRGKTAEEDEALKADLLGDAKEVSEHLMLLDLGRNDVGRIAEPVKNLNQMEDAKDRGGVRVTERMIVEFYSHVMHIVSNVEGKLAKGKDAIDALIAGFPAGTVSGAPKIRAMEIIDELEPETRSFYAGTVGYIGVNGQMDTCIALRTALVKDNVVYAQAGGGVVADSDPEAEFMETENKAGAIVAAAKNAYKFNS